MRDVNMTAIDKTHDTSGVDLLPTLGDIPFLSLFPLPPFPPSLSLPFPSLPPLSLPFPHPFPLFTARGSGGALKLPQRVRAEPGRQTHFGAFWFKITTFHEGNLFQKIG